VDTPTPESPFFAASRYKRYADQDTMTVGAYVLSKIIGTGNFSTVRLGLHAQSGREFAVKIIQRQSDASVEYAAAMNEIDLLAVRFDSIRFVHPVIGSRPQKYHSRRRVF
jgi:serine/threonine protein kinase